MISGTQMGAGLVLDKQTPPVTLMGTVGRKGGDQSLNECSGRLTERRSRSTQGASNEPTVFWSQATRLAGICFIFFIIRRYVKHLVSVN